MINRIKGWNFRRAFSADGSTTLNTLQAEKKRLENRSLEIPKLIPQLEAVLQRARQDINWLKSLKKLKRKRWEKEKGRTVEEAIYNYEKTIVSTTGKITSLRSEQKQIPTKIKAIQNQLNALVQGESKGLEKGLDKDAAKALGELELQKEKERLAHERAMREAELLAETKRQELQAEKDKQLFESKANEKAGKNQNKLFIGIGITLLLVIGGIIIYKRKVAKKTA